jgi:hypothetical protein
MRILYAVTLGVASTLAPAQFVCSGPGASPPAYVVTCPCLFPGGGGADLDLAFQGQGRIGTVQQFRVTNLDLSQPNFFVLGAPAIVPLPVPPGVIVCRGTWQSVPTLHLEPIVVVSLTGASGGNYYLRVPPEPAFLGMDVHAQAFQMLPGLGQVPFIASHVLGFTVQLCSPDRDASSGAWGGGVGRFGAIGGDGAHGEFDPAAWALDLGVIGGLQTYQIDTDNTTIPPSHTLTGTPLPVTDGRFRFTRMVVPSTMRLRFVGSNPPQFQVRGRIDIAGVVELMGEDRAPLVPLPTGPWPGQSGGRGGVSGGSGGAGGDRCLGNGPFPQYSGQNGQDVRVPGGHAYAAQTAGSGGRGSQLFPAFGLQSSVIFNAPGFAYSLQSAAGGGGGGFRTAGGPGRVVPIARVSGTSTGSNGPMTLNDTTKAWLANEFAPGGLSGRRDVQIMTGTGAGQVRTVQSNTATQLTVTIAWTVVPDATSTYVVRVDYMGPPAAGGAAFPLFPVPGGVRSSLHFLVGGSGGGGAGSSPLFSSVNAPLTAWAPGMGGGGGGGAIALRAGHTLRVAGAGRILAHGGSAATDTGTPTPVSLPLPGGGGSGGSVLLQAGDRSDVAGVIDVRGGAGGLVRRDSFQGPPIGDRAEVVGGDGGAGFVRLEVPSGPSPALLPNVQPPAGPDNVGLLTEQDALVGFQSRFYLTSPASGPTYLRYEILATVDGVPVTFSDDPTRGPPARPGSAPIHAFFQAGTVDPLTNAVNPASLRPWRTRVGFGAPSLASDGLNGYRFLLLLDRSLGQQVQILSVTVWYRNC